MQKDTKRYRKIEKDTKRWEKMGIDDDLIGGRGFSCDAANVRVLLNRRFPYLGGSWFVSDLFLGFGFVSERRGGSVYALTM